MRLALVAPGVAPLISLAAFATTVPPLLAAMLVPTFRSTLTRALTVSALAARAFAPAARVVLARAVTADVATLAQIAAVTTNTCVSRLANFAAFLLADRLGSRRTLVTE